MPTQNSLGDRQVTEMSKPGWSLRQRGWGSLQTAKRLLHLQRAAALHARKTLACVRMCVVGVCVCEFSVVRTSNILRQTENLCFCVKSLNLYMLLINSVFQKDFEWSNKTPHQAEPSWWLQFSDNMFHLPLGDLLVVSTLSPCDIMAGDTVKTEAFRQV